MLLSHLLLHVSSVLWSGWSHAHKLGLTQELDPRRLHPKSHPTLSDRNRRWEEKEHQWLLSWSDYVIQIGLFQPTECKCCPLVPLESIGSQGAKRTYCAKVTMLFSVAHPLYDLRWRQTFIITVLSSITYLWSRWFFCCYFFANVLEDTT